MCHDGERTKILEPWIRHIFSRKFALGLHLWILYYTCPLCQTVPGKCALEDFCIEKQLLEDSDAVIDWDVTVSAWHGLGFFTTSWLRKVQRPEGARAWLLELFNAWLRMIPMAAKSKLQGNSLNANGSGNHATASTLACTRSCLQAFKPTNDPEPKLLDSLKRCDSSPGKASVYTRAEVTWWKLCATQRQRSQITWEWWEWWRKPSRSTSCSFCYIMSLKAVLFPRSI